MANLVFRRQFIVEWGHCDPAGIVFNPRFFEWFDACTAGLFALAGLPKPQMLKVYGIVGIPLVETRAKFISASKFGDLVTIESRIAGFRRSSFEVEHRLINAGALAVEAYETRVWVGRDPQDPTKLKSQAIPQEVIARFAG
jgi:4-hydroxybenzoyl-CoA thioesterase